MEGLTATGLVAFNAALLAAWATPGPAFLVALRAAVVGGAGAGIATGLGLAIMAAAWTLAALLGLDILFTAFPALFLAARLIGAAYLIWLAVRLWRGAGDPLPEAAPPRGRAVVSGLLVNLANPKSMLFAAAVLVVIFPADLSLGARLAVALNHLLLELLLYTLLATLIARPRVRTAYLALKPGLDRGAAAILGALGLRLLWGRP